MPNAGSAQGTGDARRPGSAAIGGRLRRSLAEIEGGPASYLSVGGGGVPVLLLHGFAGDLLTWQFNLSALAADRRTIAADLPGHGGSTAEVGDGMVTAFAPWLIRLLDRLEVPQVHAVGHSMGGYVARELARIAPDRVVSLTLIASAGLGTPFDLDFLRRAAAPASLDEARYCADRLFARPSPLAGRLAEVLLAQSQDEPRRHARERIIQTAFAAHAAGGSPVDWSAYPMPVQAIWGREDRIIPMPSPDRLPPDAPFQVLDDAGHVPHSEASTQVTAAIRSFLRTCDPS